MQDLKKETGISLQGADVLIYGAGGNGRILYETIRDECNVIGFIDQRAGIIREYAGNKVYSLDELTEYKEFACCIVFITLKNVFVHDKIARTLIDKGMKYLVYKPGNVLRGTQDEREREVDRAYETLVENRVYCNVKVPLTDLISYRLSDSLLINKQENEVTAWVPVELVSNYRREDADLPGCPMIFFPLSYMYEGFMGKGMSWKDAVNSICRYSAEWLIKNDIEMTEHQKQSILKSRLSVYQHMQQTADCDIDFFKRNAPFVECINGRLYLVSSGRNRISFLIAKGWRYVPVRMSEVDYGTICERELVGEYEKRLSSGLIDKVFGSIPNSYLVGVSCVFADYQRLFLLPIIREIVKTIFDENVIDMNGMEKYDWELIKKVINNTRVCALLADDEVGEKFMKGCGFNISETPARADYLFLNMCKSEPNESRSKVFGCSENDESTHGDLIEIGNAIDLIDSFTGKAVYFLLNQEYPPDTSRIINKSERLFTAAGLDGYIEGYRYCTAVK